jgi:hypothetical protein
MKKKRISKWDFETTRDEGLIRLLIQGLKTNIKQKLQLKLDLT